MGQLLLATSDNAQILAKYFWFCDGGPDAKTILRWRTLGGTDTKTILRWRTWTQSYKTIFITGLFYHLNFLPSNVQIRRLLEKVQGFNYSYD